MVLKSTTQRSQQKMFKPSEKQMAVFDFVKNGQGNAIIEAVAGSGKTTTIVNALEHMHGYVFLGAYNKKMADELQIKVGGKKGVKAATFHSVGYGALRFAYGKQHALNVDNKKVDKIVKDIEELDQQGLTTDYAPVIGKIVSMAKQRGIGALSPINDKIAWYDMVDHFGLMDEASENVDLEIALKWAAWALKKSCDDLETVDFDDMVYLPLRKNLRMLQNDWVLIDEAQDTNPTRRALAKRMLKPNGRLIAVGDPYQAIYGFSGADNDSLEQIARDFDAISLPLTITYRCPKAVVRMAQQWVPHIEAGDTAPVGLVETMSLTDMIANVSVEDAIICRYNKYLADLCFKLIRMGIPAKIEGRAIGEGLIKLATRWKRIKGLPALSDQLEQWRSREVTKAIAKELEDKADRINDQVETLQVLIDGATDKGFDTVDGLCGMIATMFDDGTDAKPVVTLCSCHKSKGMEWDRVFLLGRQDLMPSRFAVRDWQIQQEINLMYVSVTRAMNSLVEVPLEAKQDA
jgi:superfamily I DNA/RNA helicase